MTMVVRERRDAQARAVLFWIGLAVAVSLMAILLEAAYAETIAPAFGYIGERARSIHLLDSGIAIIATWLVGITLPRAISDLGDFCLWVLYILTAVPVMLVPQFADLCTPGQALQLVAFTAVSFPFVVFMVRHGPHDIVPLHTLSPTSFWLGVLFVTLASYTYLFAITGVTLATPSITDIYDLRTQYRNLIADHGPLLGYDIRLIGTILNPLLMAQGLQGRRHWLLAIGLLGQMVIYSVTGYRLTLLSGIAILLVALYFRYSRKRSALVVLFGVVVFVLACISIDKVRQSILMTTIFVYRLIISSGTLPAVYIDFFSDRAKVGWSDSFLGGVVDAPYPAPMVYVVGNYHTGNAQVTANSNYIADGFGNYGMAGVMIEALMLAALLLAIRSSARKVPTPFAAALMITPLIALANSSPFTAVLSNGFIVAIIIFMLFPEMPTSANLKDQPGLVDRSAKRARTRTVLARSPAKRLVLRPARFGR